MEKLQLNQGPDYQELKSMKQDTQMLHTYNIQYLFAIRIAEMFDFYLPERGQKICSKLLFYFI